VLLSGVKSVDNASMECLRGIGVAGGGEKGGGKNSAERERREETALRPRKKGCHSVMQKGGRPLSSIRGRTKSGEKGEGNKALTIRKRKEGKTVCSRKTQFVDCFDGRRSPPSLGVRETLRRTGGRGGGNCAEESSRGHDPQTLWEIAN